MMDERAVWLLDQRINRRGVQVDIKFVARAALIVGELTKQLNSEIAALTQDFVKATSQIKKLQIWMACEGVRLDSLRKDVITEWLTRDDLDARVREAFELRQAGAKSSTAKLNALLNRTCADGRIRDNLMYHAASTGRWGGKGFQPQNLPRPIKEMSPYIARALDIIRDGCTTEEFVEYVNACHLQYRARWASTPHSAEEVPVPFRPLDMISCCLRPCIIAAPGYELILADYSSIEARGTAWLALAQELLRVFQNGGDPYLYMACLIDGVPQGTYNKNDHPGPRQRGKVAILGLGYQMGAAKFQATCHKERIFITELEAKHIVDVYRAENPEIPDLWTELEHAALDAVSSRSGLVTTAGAGRVKFVRQGTWLYMQLPSGRILSYASPAIVQREMPWIDHRSGQKAKKWCVSYMGVSSLTHQWCRQYGYGGKWCENAVQGFCRDTLAGAMLRLESRSYPLVLSVHDEPISEVPAGFGSVKEYEDIICMPEPWMVGPPATLPVTAEGHRGVRYGK